jgi:hypothetical protein
MERAAFAADLGINDACAMPAAISSPTTATTLQEYLGHRNIQNTTRYTALAPQLFKEFFRD